MDGRMEISLSPPSPGARPVMDVSIAWGAGRLCRPRTIAGDMGTSQVPIKNANELVTAAPCGRYHRQTAFTDALLGRCCTIGPKDPRRPPCAR
jgi:hypothetical protein